MLISKEEKFDFNDILLVPEIYSNIESRYKDINPYYDVLKLPLLTAPMDTVVDENSVDTYLNNGIGVVLPRTIKDISSKELDYYNFKGVFVSYGLKEFEYLLNNNNSIDCIPKYILIDTANGHLTKIINICKKAKKIKPDIIIMAGNIANPETYRHYAENDCVDYIRVIIGNGNGCLTSQNCGVGYSVGSLIYETYLIKKELELLNKYAKLPYIVADGGMKNYSDVIKVLGLGANFCMCGSLFNKGIESAGYNYLYGIKINNKLAKYLFDKGFPIKKHFRGMSTKGAQKAMGKTKLKTSEGVTRYRNVEYTLDGWVENFEHYLRSAMSYCDASTLEEFIGQAKFILISNNSFKRFNK